MKAKTFEQRAKDFTKEENALLVKHGISKTVTIIFPKRKDIPLLSKLAAKLIIWQGGQHQVVFMDTTIKK